MTISEILAKVTGLEGKITDLESAKASATASHQDLEAKLAQAQSELTAIRADASAKPEPGSQDKLKAAHDALQKVLSEIAALLADGGKEKEPEPEGDGSEGDDGDPEAKAVELGKRAVSAVKALKAQKAKAAAEATTLAAAAQLARIGIEAPVQTDKTGGAGNPLDQKRAEARSAWFANLPK